MGDPGRAEQSGVLRDAVHLIGSWLWVGIGAMIGYVMGERRTLSRVEQPALRALSLERAPDSPPSVRSVVSLLEELESLVATDRVTGVHSRYRITLDLALAGAAAQTYGSWLGLCVVDVDHFKRVNDEHGHPAGDKALAEIGSRLSRALTGKARIGRYGGEEFLVVLPWSDDEDTRDTAEALRNAVERDPIALPDGTGVSLTVSIGAVSSYGPYANAEQLANAADTAMYEAKDNGRNQVVFKHVRTDPGPREMPLLFGQRVRPGGSSHSAR